MKNVLIVDAAPMFKEFLKDKLTEEKIEVTFIQDKRDAITKMINLLPDLVIFDISDTDNHDYLIEIFSKIKKDINASRIPIIATGSLLPPETIATFAKLGVIKYFLKPIKFDAFFEKIGHILRTAFSMDVTPCVLDIHRNGNIIFIEIALGLNREKLSLLKYKLSEIIENEEMTQPKVILMMTNLELTFMDGLNLELLLNNILANPVIQTKNIKVLSFNNFTKQLIDGHPEYSGIEVAQDISEVLNSLVDSSITSSVSDLITDKILTPTDENSAGSIEMRFSSDSTTQQDIIESIETKVTQVALVDDDKIVLNLLSAAFKKHGMECKTFSNGTDFLSALAHQKFDIIILDIMMPGISGFDTLRRMNRLPSKPLAIIYSQAIKREIIIQALSLGAKQYLVKPQKPESVVSKAIELLNNEKKQ